MQNHLLQDLAKDRLRSDNSCCQELGPDFFSRYFRQKLTVRFLYLLCQHLTDVVRTYSMNTNCTEFKHAHMTKRLIQRSE